MATIVDLDAHRRARPRLTREYDSIDQMRADQAATKTVASWINDETAPQDVHVSYILGILYEFMRERGHSHEQACTELHKEVGVLFTEEA